MSAQRSNTATELSSKKSQIELLTAEMKDLPADQKQAIDEHGSFTAGQRAVSNYTESVQSAVDDIDASAQRIDQLRQDLKPSENTEPNAAVAAMRNSTLSALETARIALLNVKDALTSTQATSGQFRDAASVGLAEHELRYGAAASQNAALQARLEQIRQMSADVDSLTSALDDVDSRLTNLGQVDDRFKEAREQWKTLADEYFQLLTNQASALTSASKGELKVSVSKAKEIANLVEQYTQTIQGSQVTRDKIVRLISTVASNADPIKEWVEIVDELLNLIEAQKASTVAVVPKMSSASIWTSELNRIASRVTATSAFELSLIRPETYPTFSYRMPDGSYIPFQDASPGQQANALLALLFGQAIGPLVIDQPEDDLDNATALQIAESIWTAKEKRQLIIASHNPNLVVIGDAELVLNCKHFKPNSGGSPVGISLQGGLDMRDVRDVVANVMEGGKDAFQLRMSRYGY